MGNFNGVLKSLRTAKGLTQIELSKILKISRSTIGMYESGAREPDFETLELIADYFNVDTDYLIGRTRKTTYIPCPEQFPEITSIYKELNNVNKEKAVCYSQNLLVAQQMEEEATAQAAHERTDIEVTDEMKQHDDDIMDDDDF